MKVQCKEIDKKRLKFNLQFSLEAHAYCKNNTPDEEGNQDPFMPDDKRDQGKLLFKHIVK